MKTQSIRAERGAAFRLALINFLLAVGFQGTYFVGIIGCATYVLHANAFAVSLLVFFYYVLYAASIGGSGVVVDALGPRKTLLGSIIAMIIAGICGVAVPVTYLSLGVFTLIDSVASGVFSCSIDAFPRYISEKTETLQRINSYNNIALNIAIIVGPSAGALITHQLPNQYVFSIMIISGLLALGVMTGLHELLSPTATTRPQEKESSWHNFKEGLAITFSHVDLRLLFFIGFFGFFAYGAFDSLESLFYRDTLRASAEWMGWLSAIAGMGGSLGSLAVARLPKKHLTIHTLALLLLVTGIGSVIYVCTSSILIAAIGQFITGVGFGSMGPVRVTLAQERSDISNVGRVISVLRMGMNIAGTVPLLFAPFLAAVLGVQGVLIAASVLVALIALVFLGLSRNR